MCVCVLVTFVVESECICACMCMYVYARGYASYANTFYRASNALDPLVRVFTCLILCLHGMYVCYVCMTQTRAPTSENTMSHDVTKKVSTIYICICMHMMSIHVCFTLTQRRVVCITDNYECVCCVCVCICVCMYVLVLTREVLLLYRRS